MNALAARTRKPSRWVLPSAPDPAAVAALASELHLPPMICELLLRRGHHTPELAKRYLRPRLDQLHDPALMLGMDVAVARLSRAIRTGERIVVHGDYDVDGMCSTTVLLRTIRKLGGDAQPFIPRRIEDGYDLTMAGVNAAIAANAKVLVTCDCGTNALAPVEAACKAGLDVIITDHHLPSGPLPECLAVLNPKRDGCEYPDKDLAAVGIAFKLSLALTRAMGGNEDDVYGLLDLVALATIADVAPLRGENRVLARAGLKLMANSPNAGLRALIRASGLEGKTLNAGRIGFILAPRLNAVGRLGHALRGVELLMSENDHEANAIARELEELNRHRQDVDRKTLARARELIDALDLDATHGIVLAEDGWHPGVIGIVASRLLEEHGRPVLLIALDGDEGKGSGRSISAFDLHAALAECRDLLVRFGGHRAAAGVTVTRENIPELARRFNEIALAQLTVDDLVAELRVDLELPLSEATFELEALLRHFEPFGPTNPTPVLVSRGVRLAAPARVMGDGHLKLRLQTDTGEVEAIGWGMAALAHELDAAVPFDIAYRLERDDWNGAPRLQVKLAAVRH
ncbi:MAG TPA: single-stranded-DNA-specific exonuclease RecJ [Gemmatimonadaceae bacterium]|nr:single-stranded-DNA-specific exonuclease RecJ [Gemmatimonadaceae bacterium]